MSNCLGFSRLMRPQAGLSVIFGMLIVVTMLLTTVGGMEGSSVWAVEDTAVSAPPQALEGTKDWGVYELGTKKQTSNSLVFANQLAGPDLLLDLTVEQLGNTRHTVMGLRSKDEPSNPCKNTDKLQGKCKPKYPEGHIWELFELVPGQSIFEFVNKGYGDKYSIATWFNATTNEYIPEIKRRDDNPTTPQRWHVQGDPASSFLFTEFSTSDNVLTAIPIGWDSSKNRPRSYALRLLPRGGGKWETQDRGGPVFSAGLSGVTKDTCSMACRNNGRCKVVTYSASSRQCYLKEVVGDTRSNGDYTAWVKTDPNSQIWRVVAEIKQKPVLTAQNGKAIMQNADITNGNRWWRFVPVKDGSYLIYSEASNGTSVLAAKQGNRGWIASLETTSLVKPDQDVDSRLVPDRLLWKVIPTRQTQSTGEPYYFLLNKEANADGSGMFALNEAMQIVLKSPADRKQLWIFRKLKPNSSQNQP